MAVQLMLLGGAGRRGGVGKATRLSNATFDRADPSTWREVLRQVLLKNEHLSEVKICRIDIMGEGGELIPESICRQPHAFNENNLLLWARQFLKQGYGLRYPYSGVVSIRRGLRLELLEKPVYYPQVDFLEYDENGKIVDLGEPEYNDLSETQVGNWYFLGFPIYHRNATIIGYLMIADVGSDKATNTMVKNMWQLAYRIGQSFR